MKIGGEANMYSLIRQLKNDGHAILSSVSKYHVALGALTASSFLLVFKDGQILLDLLSTIGRIASSEQKGVIAGLNNLGNNCFLNVILQALASCESFNQFIQKIVEEDGEEMPLTNDLAALLRELCIIHERRVVLSPQKVMREMADYIPSFNVRMQQDAAEAFLHLLSSLREELSESYVPHSLADIYAFPRSRISRPLWGHQSEQQKWQQYLLGPFDGILCSTLSCRSCSSQLSMGYEFFHSLSLSPLLDGSQTMLKGSSIVHCLRKFTAAELIENYHCNQCWHNSAIRYLSTIKGNETLIGELKCCIKEDLCDCMNLFPEKAMPWSNNISRTIKQLRVARCPKILCIHFQRASVNKLGESVKIQGHISFPTILDLFPFMGGKTENMSASSFIYQLVSVVKHFGVVGSGHYTVYRRVKDEWFYASDSHVYSVSEDDVLGTEASLLFYERIDLS